MKKVYAIYKTDYVSDQSGEEHTLDSIWTNEENARMYLRNIAEQYNLPFISKDRYSNKYDTIYITELNADTPDLYEGY